MGAKRRQRKLAVAGQSCEDRRSARIIEDNRFQEKIDSRCENVSGRFGLTSDVCLWRAASTTGVCRRSPRSRGQRRERRRVRRKASRHACQSITPARRQLPAVAAYCTPGDYPRRIHLARSCSGSSKEQRRFHSRLTGFFFPGGGLWRSSALLGHCGTSWRLTPANSQWLRLCFSRNGCGNCLLQRPG